MENQYEVNINYDDIKDNHDCTVAYYLKYVAENLYSVKINDTRHGRHHILIIDKTNDPGAEIGAFTCPESWLTLIGEPKVLTTSEYMDLALSEPGQWENKDIATAFQEGDKNGQRRYKRLRQWAENNVSPENSLFKILSNIKPL